MYEICNVGKGVFIYRVGFLASEFTRGIQRD